jgi:hypothetical protein
VTGYKLHVTGSEYRLCAQVCRFSELPVFYIEFSLCEFYSPQDILTPKPVCENMLAKSDLDLSFKNSETILKKKE